MKMIAYKKVANKIYIQELPINDDGDEICDSFDWMKMAIFTAQQWNNSRFQNCDKWRLKQLTFSNYKSKLFSTCLW